jgi:transcriptional regulator with XRE-family HTH domain
MCLGLSQNATGKAIGTASQQVQKYEKDVNGMNAKRLYDFALFLKVPVAYFFEGLTASGGAAPWGIQGGIYLGAPKSRQIGKAWRF